MLYLHVSSVNHCFIRRYDQPVVFLTDKNMHMIYYEDITLIDVHPRGSGVCRGRLVTHPSPWGHSGEWPPSTAGSPQRNTTGVSRRQFVLMSKVIIKWQNHMLLGSKFPCEVL